MNTPNNAAALERLETKMRRAAPQGVMVYADEVGVWADELATLRATLAQPDALTSQPSGEMVAEVKDNPDDVGTYVDTFVSLPVGTKLFTHPSADAPGVAVDEAMIGRFKMACRALMGLRGQRSTVYAEDLETMVDVLRVLEYVATLPVVNEAMVGRAYSAFANAKIADPTDTRARIRFALTAALAPKPEGGHAD